MKKKVLIISMAYFPRFVGGAEVAVKEITNRLSDEFEFHLITLRYDSSLPRESKEGNVFVHRIGFAMQHPTIADLRKFPLRLLKPWFQFGAYFAARRLHVTHNFTYLWAMMAHSSGVPAGLFKKKCPEVRYLLTLQEGDPPEVIEKQMSVFGTLFANGFIRADAIQCISTFLGAWAKRMGGARIEVIPNGVDYQSFDTTETNRTEVRASCGLTNADIVVVTASRLVHKTGIDTVIKALPLLPSHIKFLVLGAGPQKAMLQDLAAKLGVTDRVIFKGEVSYTHLPAFLHASDMFIRMSRSEGMGNAFVEAMAAKLPTIGTAVGGIVDFLREGETGFVATPDNPESVKQAIERVLSDPQATAIVTETASRMVREKYDWELIGSQMRRLFNSL